MTRETLTENEISALVEEIKNTLTAMRKAKLLNRGVIMSHIGKNNAKLRDAAIILDSFGYALGDTRETRRLMIWNEYLKMELERITRIPQDLRNSKMIQKPTVKVDNTAAITAFLSGKR